MIGPVIGAVFFVLVRDVLAANLVDFHLIIFGILFIVVVLILPGGLFEGWKQLQEWGKSLLKPAAQAGDATKASQRQV